jgi:hypothetical protein
VVALERGDERYPGGLASGFVPRSWCRGPGPTRSISDQALVDVARWLILGEEDDDHWAMARYNAACDAGQAEALIDAALEKETGRPTP